MLMRFSTITLLLGVTLLSTRPPADVETAPKQWTGCPVRSFYDVDAGPKFSVSWTVTGEAAAISFQADRILLGGGKGMMTPSQLAQWEPYLAELRNAASQRLKVLVFYDDVTHAIAAIDVLYDQKC